MWRIKPQKIIEDGCIKEAIYNVDGRLMLEKCDRITDEIRAILLRDDHNLYVMTKANYHFEDKLPVMEEPPVEEKLITLTEEVKQSAVNAIEFLYSSPDINDGIEKIEDLSNTIVDLIVDNDSVGVSLDTLKCSDEYTFKHSLDVASIAIMIGKMLGLSTKELKELSTAGLLHDLGKIKVPNDILNARRKLTDVEFNMIKTHPVYGYQNIMDVDSIPDTVKVGVLQHHEKWNGNGYPQKLKEKQISLYARIISIADVYDALVTARPYKEALSPSTAIEMMMAMTPDFDIDILRVFLRSIVLYPIGSEIMLSNGQVATVMKNNPQNVLRPEVKTKEGVVYDLFNDLNCLTITVLDKLT
jgi:HD-GYP domain-containing protein (c-di-GMP phosphodiesterase class II)